MLNNFQKKLLIKISVASSVLALIIVAIIILGSYVSKNSEYITETRNALNSRLNAISQLARLKAQSVEAKPYIDELERALPSRDGILLLQSEMENIARQNNLGFTFRWTGVEQSVSAGLGSVDFQVILQGDYGSIRDFMEGVDETPYFIQLLDFDAVESQAGRYNTTIRGTTFFKELEKLQ